MFIDCHTHIQFNAFTDDWRQVLDRSLRQNVWLINVGTQKDTSKKAVEIAEAYKDGVYACVGLHPIHTGETYHDEEELGGGEAAKAFSSRGEEFDKAYYLELAKNVKTVAIGECGLDYYQLAEESLKKRQKEAFEAQIELSKEVGKPLMIHSRAAFPDTLAIIKSAKAEGGIAHSFVETVDEARELLDLGFYFTFAGNITFKPKAGKPSRDEVIKFIPMNRLLSETDAPYLAPVPYRGKRNEPIYVIEVVRKLAEIKDVSLGEMEEQIFANAKKIFKL